MRHLAAARQPGLGDAGAVGERRADDVAVQDDSAVLRLLHQFAQVVHCMTGRGLSAACRATQGMHDMSGMCMISRSTVLEHDCHGRQRAVRCEGPGTHHAGHVLHVCGLQKHCI